MATHAHADSQSSHTTPNNEARMGSKKVKSYEKEQKNARALCQASSWLEAVGIDHRRSQTPGLDLILVKADGSEVEVKVAASAEEPRPASEHVFVVAADVTSRHLEVALKTFHVMTEAAGFGSPMPVDRGQAPEAKLHYGDNFELVSMRHNEFRRVPNPETGHLLQYKPVMEKACYRFVNMNPDTCRRHCLQIEDLMTYAMVWTTNYIGLYEVANPTNNDNERKLSRHLKQRFSEFADMIRKKERNCIPSADAASVAMAGVPVRAVIQSDAGDGDGGCHYELAVDPFTEEEIDSDYVRRHNELGNLEDAVGRRSAAATVLAKNLNKLPHDRLLEVLQGAADNQALCPDTKAEAARQLRLHRRNCETCSGVKIEASAPTTETVASEKPATESASTDSRAQFLAGLAPTKKCPCCGVEKATAEYGVRLMNKAAFEAGAQAPKYRIQAQCKPCRSTKKPSKGQMNEDLAGADAGGSVELA